MRKPDNCILVIFGASGDLTKRKLVPALFESFRRGLLPDSFAVLGAARTPFTDDQFRACLTENVNQYCENKPIDPAQLQQFVQCFSYVLMDSNSPKQYAQLKSKLSELDAQVKAGGNYLFYLATPPSVFATIAGHLGTAGLTAEGNGAGWRRIVVEKPFGSDLESAKALNRDLLKAFNEKQIYRIDHYLGKETVQNVLVFRFANGIFEPLWNRNYVHHVEVTAVEFIGIEERGDYYEGTGALRDMVQNHLLQIVGMIAMEPPSSFDPEAIRNETLKVFQSLRPLRGEECEHAVVRGQYGPSKIRGKPVAGYREEHDVAPDSRTETYVAMRFYIDNWRWGGIPFFIRTGKRMPTHVTEVVIHFKPTPHALFGPEGEMEHGRNQLIIRIQPDEGILLRFGMKLPGGGFSVKDVSMDFRYADLSDTYIPDSYERLLLDCMLGDPTLFARSDVVEACWAFVDPILGAWATHPRLNLYGYPAGTWGPRAAEDLIRTYGDQWRYPCKNLAEEGEHCEL